MCNNIKAVGPIRPTRFLVELLCDLPVSFVRQEFPEFTVLWYLIRAPMIFILITDGMLSGLNMAIGKLLGEAIASGVPVLSNFVMWLTIALLVGATIQLYLLNVAMKIYRQIDVVPVYESLSLVFIIVAGLVLFNESVYYTWGELASILAGAFVIVIGIVILALKHKILHAQGLKT